MINKFLSDTKHETVQVEPKLEDALGKVTQEMCDNLEHGDELELNDTYTLYRHSEEDMWDVFHTNEWEEVAAVLFQGDTVVFEILREEVSL